MFTGQQVFHEALPSYLQAVQFGPFGKSEEPDIPWVQSGQCKSRAVFLHQPIWGSMVDQILVVVEQLELSRLGSLWFIILSVP